MNGGGVMAVAAGLGLGVILIAASAAAQSPDRTVYAAPDYAAFRPQTALDMVRRTPGFVLDEGDEDIRGFGGASGNVLIDGARPSSKAGVLDALGRIPASQVERIELIRNASTAEAQGQTTVLNVVRLAGGASGTWSVEAERNGNGVVYPRLDASLARSVAGWRTSVKARAYWEEFPFRSLRLSRDASGDLIRSTVTDLPSTLGEATLSGDASRPLGGGLLNLTGRLGHYNYYFDQPGETFLGRLPDGRPDQTQLNQLDIQRWTLEAGADWTRVFGDWSLKALSLLNYRDGSESSRERRQTAEGALISRTVVESTAEPLELVGRVTLGGLGASRLRPEFGGEIAYNRFDRTFALAIDSGSGLAPIPIPASNVTVEEVRGEAFANASLTLSPRWSVEGGLAMEGSEISVSGDADQSQSFSFVKPSLALAWKPTDRLQLRLGARRTVGQLDFNDFAATADLDDDTTAAGNPDLGPDQTTRYYASIDYRGGGDLAVNLELFHEARQDVLEQILLPSGAAGIANAGDATYRGLKGSLTLRLDRALAGARLTAEGEVLDSDFDDPVIGRRRPLSGVYSPDIEVEFRHDPPGRPISWGETWESAEQGDLYLVDEIDALRTDDVLGGFLETTAWGGFKTRLAIRNADTQRTRRLRIFYDPDRAGAVIGTEERFQRGPTFVTLTVSGSF